MNPADDIPLLLLAVHGVALGLGLIIFAWVWALHRRAKRLEETAKKIINPPPALIAFPQRPTAWVAVRSVSPEAVKLALGLGRSTPCSWAEGIGGSHEFFISPRVNDWVILTGLGLPHPSDDVDACFLFLTALSRKLGHVQFFQADRLLQHHAWARIDDGCVTRAYAWAGETLWNQGAKTLPETDLHLKCFNYGEDTATIGEVELNFEKVPALAARWSLDPAEVKSSSIRQPTGIAGESARIY